MAPAAAHVIGVDWGTTRLRAYLIDAATGHAVEELVDPDGGAWAVANATKTGCPRGFAGVLDKLLSRGSHRGWVDPTTPVVLCGMVGSRFGWIDVPYAPTPARVEDVCMRMRVVGLACGHPGLVVPGLASAAGAPDVMRGEETQIYGACAAGAGADAGAGGAALFILPGTHSKWALVNPAGSGNGSGSGSDAASTPTIHAFQTHMTGEVHALLAARSVLKESVEDDAAAGVRDPTPEYWAAFDRGLAAAAPAASSGLLADLFTVRTQHLTGALTGAGGAGYLSGLLIGSEIHAGLRWYAAHAPGATASTPGGVTVIAGATLGARYRRALARVCGDGVTVRVVDGGVAVARGLWALWRRRVGGEGAAVPLPPQLPRDETEQKQAQDAHTVWRAALLECPVIAILRGIHPDEAVAVGRALVGAGITIIEVPLNSPEWATSVRRLVASVPDGVVVGAGTVLTEADVDAVAAAGARLVVSPNCDAKVIRRCAARGVVAIPGVATPTEAFAALSYGATGLKAFPGEHLSPRTLKAWRAVLPPSTPLFAVGGVTPRNLGEYWRSGVTCYGVGTSLYAPGVGADEVGRRARGFVAAVREQQQQQQQGAKL